MAIVLSLSPDIDDKTLGGIITRWIRGDVRPYEETFICSIPMSIRVRQNLQARLNKIEQEIEICDNRLADPAYSLKHTKYKQHKKVMNDARNTIQRLIKLIPRYQDIQALIDCDHWYTTAEEVCQYAVWVQDIAYDLTDILIHLLRKQPDNQREVMILRQKLSALPVPKLVSDYQRRLSGPPQYSPDISEGPSSL